jgi:hypothetical protein
MAFLVVMRSNMRRADVFAKRAETSGHIALGNLPPRMQNAAFP